MNALLQTYTLLAASLRADPQLCLASSVTWLYPLWQDDGSQGRSDDWDVPQDEDGTLAIALRVTRKPSPMCTCRRWMLSDAGHPTPNSTV